MNFEESLNLAGNNQRARYGRLVSNFEGIELSDDENRYLLWLAGWDSETEAIFADLFKKLKCK